MKKTLTGILVAILAFSACIPSFAQKDVGEQKDTDERILLPRPGKPIFKNLTKFGRVEARSDGKGVLINWEMEAETQNVGFNVYRTGRRGRRVNETLILGAAGVASPERTVYGTSYRLLDPNGDSRSSYYVESLMADGRTIPSDPFKVKYVENIDEASDGSAGTLRDAMASKQPSVEDEKLTMPDELQDVVQSNLQTPDPITQLQVASQPGVKIAIRKEGFYRIYKSSLDIAEFPITSDSTKWRLFTDGNEQSIIVGPNADYIEFYARGIDTVESDIREYYLISDTLPGKRIDTRVLRNFGGNVVSNNFQNETTKKERSSYIKEILNGEAENFWGSIVSTIPTPVKFNLAGIDVGSANAQVTINMQGFTQVNHLVALALNGHTLPSMSWYSQNTKSSVFTVPTNWLIEGENTLEMTSASSGDFSMFDNIKVKYDRRYKAETNQLFFYTPGYKKINITGFTSTSIRVFDTTYDGNPALLSGLPVSQDGAAFAVSLPSSRGMVAFAIEDTSLLTPYSVTKNNPSSLATPNNSADLLIISHSAPDFMAAAETWANYRRSATGGSATVKVIDVADIFDEFNYGATSWVAIRNFLYYAKSNWQGPPKYVLLLGDASADPRNYGGYGNWNLIPTKFVDLIYEESVSDEALADFDDDGLAEIPIGRIPARSVSTITASLNKTMAFESQSGLSLSRGALFAYDLKPQPFDYDFLAMSQTLKSQLPGSMPTTMIGRGLAPPNENQVDPAAPANLLTAMNEGKYIINYSGHGSSGSWNTSTFFGINSVVQLTNSSNPSIYTMLTCLNGYFARPDFDSVSETLLRSPSGGAAATWASTTETTPDFQMLMATRFYHQISVGQFTRIGDQIRDAKLAIPAGTDVRLSWTLLGDPMLRVK